MKVQITVAILVVSIGLVAFWLWPYSDAFTDQYDHVADEVVRIIEANPTEEGVDKATTYYNSRQSSLRDKRDWGLKPDKNGVVSETVKEGYRKAFSRTSAKMDKLEEKYPALKRRLELLSVYMFRLE
jgi:hypothetical protein